MNEELKKLENHLTVGRLREALNNPDLKDDSLVFIENTNTTIFPEYHYKKEGWEYHSACRYNKDIKNNPELSHHILSEEELESCKVDYIPIWGVTKYNDDKEILFLDINY